MRKPVEHALRAEINVTPLVDVCLVLLIIFMVVTPMLKRIEVAVPETRKPDAMAETRRQLTVAIEQDGSVHLGPSRIPAGGLAAAFQRVHDDDPDRAIVIEGDRRLSYREVRKVMEAIGQAKFARVGLVAERKKS